jgi:hypothetical protein
MSSSTGLSGRRRTEREAALPQMARRSLRPASRRDAGRASRVSPSPGPAAAKPPRPRDPGGGLLIVALAGAAVLGLGGLLGLHYAFLPSSGHSDRALAKCLPPLPLGEWAPWPQAWAATLDRSNLVAGQDISPAYRLSYIASSCGVFRNGGQHMVVRSAPNRQGQAELLEDVFATGPAGMMCYSFTSAYAGSPLTGRLVWYHGGLIKSATGDAEVGSVTQWCHEHMGL